MIAPEKSHQYPSDYNKFLFKKRLEAYENKFFLEKKREMQVIVCMIMLNRSSEWIFNPRCHIGVVDLLRINEDAIEIIIINLMYSSIC